MTLLQTIGAIFLYIPFLLFIFIYFILLKRKKRKALGLASDGTTFLLFFSVPASVEFLWGYSVSALIYFVALILAIVYLIVEWKTVKEIEIIPFFRKLWRTYFLLLATIYAFVWLVGLVSVIIKSV
ncbi:hypothetical protein A1A1_04147 [Planococcus antarcticus DSM 14505]|uniref:DUF3397 domain-containing protein n=1 Tax=Planococcus antarcticus DSM 14505 TaxID=1185653 RepID=A0A1C7DG76_9BACL|nr:DUF3397 family protein [Planococcus antarcticus]ANU10465.1 hypothetical protein BBH88_09175 [Planococcus antarcticus DSM 14505]EIM07798.1 hypothetical protein A1A1_04147 [Planococcus antarcticus DSM 14505]